MDSVVGWKSLFESPFSYDHVHVIILNFFQINGEAEKILKEFSIPKKGRLVTFLSFHTVSSETEVLFLRHARQGFFLNLAGIFSSKLCR